MAKVHNLKEYKASRIHVKNLEEILKVINLTLRALKPYQAYTSVKKLTLDLDEERMILESHYLKYKKIKENKGNKNE